MSINSLRLKGFKSFGSPCEFDFGGERGFTAIVGPNGSGKSNILDALRWILGEGSNSALRIVRQGDLLFQGSISVPPAKEAEVSLTLSEDGQKALLRRVFTQEEGSSLLLDGKKILLQELAGVKERFALGGAGFAFIGQGEVAAAIHQKPRERRRQLDLLFGVERYRDRRDDTLRRLDEAMSEVQRIQTLIQDLEAQRAEIADDVGVAVQAQGILDNLDALRRDFYFSRRLALEGEALSLRSKRQVLLARLDGAERWRDLWRRGEEAAAESLRSQGFDEPAFTAKAAELAAQKDALRRRAFQAGTQIKSLLEDRAALTSDLAANGEAAAKLGADLERTRRQEAELAADLERANSTLEEALRQLEEGRANLERERGRRQALRDELAQKRLALSQAEAELKALASQEAGGLERAEEERDRREEALNALEARLGELEERHAKLLAQHTAAFAACQRQAAALAQTRRERSAKEAELDALRDSAQTDYPGPVAFLVSAASLGRMRSRPVVAASAFSCPEPLSGALEAYLGGRQFWLLVHTMEEAQEGIELLKQRNAGRATYLPLERCRPRDRDFRFRLPTKGVVGWAMDLVEVQDPWGPALAHIMGDLLIVEDYPLGSGLVRQGARFPIVTLEGDVFAPAGTVSGGRSRPKGSPIAHNQRIANLTASLSDLEARAGEGERALRRAEAQEKDLAASLQTAAEERERVRTERDAESRALGALRANLERMGVEREEAEARKKALAEGMEADRARAEALEAELAGLAGLTEEPDSALAPLRSEAALAEERLRGVRAVADRMAQEHEGLLARGRALEEDLTRGREAEAARREELSALGRETLALHRAAQELQRRLEEAKGRSQRAHDRLQRLRARLDRADAAAAARTGEIAAATERLSALEGERAQLVELWDEKYPYDAAQAREVEGGRDLTSALRKLERELRALGPYNLGALSQDKALMERIDFLADQLEDVRGGADELRRLIQETDAQVENTFTEAMTEIDGRFNQLFQRLFGGGEARLTLQEGESIWERGVEIYARPPGKRLQNISQLSGGEQSLTAIAQLFSALAAARVPLAVLDEVDAALDEYNLIRFADLAREYSRSLQLIVMTHRRATMERADLIYGVTMVEPGLSRIVGIDVESYR